jgi:hypothetical protein
MMKSEIFCDISIPIVLVFQLSPISAKYESNAVQKHKTKITFLITLTYIYKL